MKEHPILFSYPMVRAILEGRKTQTRRVMKPQPEHVNGATWVHHNGLFTPCRDELCRGMLDPIDIGVKCPFGNPGDRLWVRETWDAPPGSELRTEVAYRADYESDPDGARWRPSLFMPRWACRLLLEVTRVRIERLLDITEEDARAEGARSDAEQLSALSHLRGAEAVRSLPSRLRTARDDFRDIWDSLNSKRAPWSSNPWVWVVEFRRLDGAPKP